MHDLYDALVRLCILFSSRILIRVLSVVLCLCPKVEETPLSYSYPPAHI